MIGQIVPIMKGSLKILNFFENHWLQLDQILLGIGFATMVNKLLADTGGIYFMYSTPAAAGGCMRGGNWLMSRLNPCLNKYFSIWSRLL